MTGRLFSGNARTATVLIDRVGVRADVYEPDGTATENKYGKFSDTDITYTKRSEEVLHRSFPDDDMRQRERSVSGGTVDMSSPNILASNDVVLQEDWHVEFPDGERYRLIEEMEFPTHQEWRVELING